MAQNNKNRGSNANASALGFEATRHDGNVNSYYDDPHDATDRFDFVLANPPFNVNAVDTALRVSARRHPEGDPQDLPGRQDHERLKDSVGPGRRFPFGLPRTDNVNYLWIQLFHSALNEKGRAGFVMANGAKYSQSFSMRIADDVSTYATELGISEEESLKPRITKFQWGSRKKAQSFTTTHEVRSSRTMTPTRFQSC